jgi:DNA-binding NtrC family response regulator
MQWIADRFFRTDESWVDAASGRAVRLRLLPSEGVDELAWNEECARLANLRHPLLATLLDYGPAGSGSLFEAFEQAAPVHAPASSGGAERLFRQVTQFLRANDVGMPPDRAAHAMRPVAPGRGGWRRALALTIQGRRALESIEEALDGLSPAGPVTVNVSGATHAGLRTVLALTARSARLRGFVTVCPSIAARAPHVRRHLAGRHVCILDDVDEAGRSAAAVSQLIASIATDSARRHVVVRFRRDGLGREAGIVLEPLGLRALVGMVFAQDGDPAEPELFAAARAAHGLPGAFVARLCGGTYPFAQTSMVVHETSPAYAAGAPAPRGPAPVGGRTLGAALRAPARASALARRGRHAASTRVLERAIRVLDGRGRTAEAARGAILLGWLALDRGATAMARTYFERAQAAGVEAVISIEATIASGIAMTDDQRLVEAEAVLRGAGAAAETIHDSSLAAEAAAGLARTLFWQERFDEAVAVAARHREHGQQPGTRARLLAVMARAHARLGRAPLAVRTARDAQQAATHADARVQASAERALAEAQAAAGDTEGARAAIARAVRLARAHHQPLARVRAQLLLAAIDPSGRSARYLARLRRLPLPPLLAHRVQQAATAPAPASLEPVAVLERLLDLSHRAADDGAAIAGICAAAAERLGASGVAVYAGDERALAVHGRGWPSMPQPARLVLAHGAPSGADPAREPQECGEPVRFGGAVIAVLVCRWPAGAVVDRDGAAMFLRAAALSVAPHARAVLDHPPAPPPSAWGDLIGESAAAATLRESVSRAARAPFPVLIEGESGCGKELVARAVHRLGSRRDRRFCALNCAALTDDLVETELFGHARGAFTGAAGERAGLFEEADGGTMFLDEVGELSGRAQAKLLRVLQEGEVRRVGENLPRRVDVRVVAATNRQLEDEVQAGRFRSDLRFRLDVVRIAVPPLRERTADIPLLAAHFWQDASARVGSRATLSGDALAALARYDWPGNVRELQNVIAWIAVHSPRRGRVGPSALPQHVAQATVPAHRTFEAAREEFERRFVRAALAGANGQRTRAAEALGVTRQGLAKMIRRLGLDA